LERSLLQGALLRPLSCRAVTRSVRSSSRRRLRMPLMQKL